MSYRRRGALVSAAAVLSLTATGPVALAAQDAAVPAPAVPAAPSTPADYGTLTTADGLLDPIGGLLGGLLGPLTGTLNGLLGSSQLTSLNGVTGLLGGGGTPSATNLAPVTGWLSSLAAVPGLDTTVKGTINQVLGLLNTSTPNSALSVPSLTSLTSLLGVLGGTSGLNSGGLSALTGLVSALTGALGSITSAGGTGGTPSALPIIGSLPIGDGLLAPLQSVIGVLSGGSTATGSLLQPVTALLRQVAALPGMDTILGPTLENLADQVDSQSGALTTGLLGTLLSTLQSLAATAGVPAPVADLINTITGLLGGSSTGNTTPVPNPGGGGGTTPAPKPGTNPGTSTRAATKVGGVRISGVTLDRRLGTVRVALQCPATGPACLTLLTAYRGNLLEVTSPLVYVARGTTVKKTLRFKSATHRLIGRKTTTFKIGALLPTGKATTRNVTAKLPKKKVVKKAVKKSSKKTAAKRSSR
jgi:hypothetical protein